MDRETLDYHLNVFRSHLSAIEQYMSDDAVQEIMINGPGNVFIEASGQMQKIDGLNITEGNMRAAVKALAGANAKDINPVLDCRMPGYRIAAALPPVGINGAAICIRKHARVVRSVDDYQKSLVVCGAGGGNTRHVAAGDPPNQAEVALGGDAALEMMKWIVRARVNVVIAGSTGSGKTTFMNAMLGEVPETERVVTIEDTAELQIKIPNYVGLEADESHQIGIRNLVRLSLRFRPDRVVVGEVRGAEAYDLLDVMNTGHSGGFCSLHANGPEMALSRLESMVRMNPDAQNLPLNALRDLIANTFSYVIYCSHRGTERGPEQLVRIDGLDDKGDYRVTRLFDRRG